MTGIGNQKLAISNGVKVALFVTCAIMQSIRLHLAESARVSSVERDAGFAQMHRIAVSENGRAVGAATSAVTIFRERVESVGGHCGRVQDEREAARALNAIINDLRVSSKSKPDRHLRCAIVG